MHIPKTGGVSVEQALDMFGDDEQEDREKLYGRIKSGDLLAFRFPSPVLQHLRIVDLHKIVPEKHFSEFFKFAFVRNPWDRMVSLYLFTVLMQKEKGIVDRLPPFEDFLLHGLNPFLRLQQCQFISDDNGRITIDFVGRFENINEDFQKVRRNLGMPPEDLPHENRIRHKHYSAYYTEETRRLVAGIFRDDIEIFGYEFEEPGRLQQKEQRILPRLRNPFSRR